jgi:predicted membrane-bound spermidine synthase/tetratricopeptide (TPR) repeat protein
MLESNTSSRLRSGLLSVLLVVSGFCGISYEVLYARLFNNLIGDQFAVYTAILLTFLIGIGLGTLLAHRLWPHLWLLEAGIGVYAFAAAWNVELIVSLPAGFGWSVAVTVALLIVPAFLIGTTLPLFAGYLNKCRAARAFARAYALYNLGAFLTALAVEFWLLRAVGLRTSIALIASLNCLTASLLALIAWPLRKVKREQSAPLVIPKRYLVALAIASVASAVFQLTMIRLLEFLFGPFHETFALALAAVLLGIAVGSALVRGFRLTFGSVMAGAVLGCTMLLAGFVIISECYAALYPLAAERGWLMPVIKFAVTFLLMAIPATCFGATVPALLTAYRDVTRDSGRVLAISCFANGAGFLLMAFFLHPMLGYGLLLVVVAGISCISLFVYVARIGLPTAAVAASFLLVLGAYAACWDEELLYLGHTSFHSLDDLEEARSDLADFQTYKGPHDVFAITWLDGEPYFFINGYISIPLSSPSEKLVGALSAAFAPRPDRALVLGVGSGATASTVGLLFREVDAVEINPVVLDNLWRLARYNFELPAMKNVRLICDDAIHYLKRHNQRYSLVLNTVTTPLYFSSSKLYTKEFLESVKQHLTADGLYVTWLDSRIGDEGLDIILSTLAGTFKHCAVACVRAEYFLLLCSDKPVQAHLAEDVVNCERLKADLLTNYEVFLDWVPYSLLVRDAYRLIGNRDVRLNTLDYPSLEFAMSRLSDGSIDGFLERLTEAMSVEEVRAAYEVSDFEAVVLYLRAEEWLGDCAITRRWEELVRGSEAKFEQRVAEAQREYAAEFARRVRSAEAYIRYASVLSEGRAYAEAADVLRLAVAKRRRCDGCYLKLGICMEKLGDVIGALDLYRRELELDPSSLEAREGLARVLLKLGRLAEALYEIDASVFAGFESAELHYLRGQALEELGFVEEAAREYKQAVKLDPELDAALLGYARAFAAAARDQASHKSRHQSRLTQLPAGRARPADYTMSEPPMPVR